MEQTIWDPLRKMQVAATPEERVRQWFIAELRATFGVPEHMMRSEVGFEYGAKRYRADILVFGRDGKPLAVVECKRPEVAIDANVARQALRYDAVLSVKWIFLTNGTGTRLFRRDGSAFVAAAEIPDYNSMNNIK